MTIKRYNEFIMEGVAGDIFSKLAKFNIPDLNYLLNNLIKSSKEDKKEICEEIIDVLKLNKIDISELKEDIEKLPYI